MPLNETTVEDAARNWFSDLGYAVGHGPEMVPGEAKAERATSSEVELRRDFGSGSGLTIRCA